jgi:tryptophanyl-tRNA synthetase
MARILTGIQSSGRPHLGNILGAIKPAIALSQDAQNESFFFIADLHSLTSLKDADQRIEFTRAIAATWLAFGFDTNKNVFWQQSKVREHTELAWYLNCYTPFPMLANAHSFKDKSERLNSVNAGLFTYPVLQAADILLYDAEIVPVGKDQKQHLEMTRDIAAAVNSQTGKEVFVLPESRIDERLMVIPGIDGQKMSKSYGNYIDIFALEKELKKVVKRILSDSTPLEEPKNPDADITFQLFSLVASDAEVADMRARYLAGGYGYGHAKQALFEVLMREFEEPRRIFDYYMANPTELDRILSEGEEKARAIAQVTISRVREALGFA